MTRGDKPTANGALSRYQQNPGGASVPRLGPSTIDPYSRRPPSCFVNNPIGARVAGLPRYQGGRLHPGRLSLEWPCAQRHMRHFCDKPTKSITPTTRTGVPQVGQSTVSTMHKSIHANREQSPRSIRVTVLRSPRKKSSNLAHDFLFADSSRKFSVRRVCEGRAISGPETASRPLPRSVHARRTSNAARPDRGRYRNFSEKLPDKADQRPRRGPMRGGSYLNPPETMEYDERMAPSRGFANERNP